MAKSTAGQQLAAAATGNATPPTPPVDQSLEAQIAAANAIKNATNPNQQNMAVQNAGPLQQPYTGFSRRMGPQGFEGPKLGSLDLTAAAPPPGGLLTGSFGPGGGQPYAPINAVGPLGPATGYFEEPSLSQGSPDPSLENFAAYYGATGKLPSSNASNSSYLSELQNLDLDYLNSLRYNEISELRFPNDSNQGNILRIEDPSGNVVTKDLTPAQISYLKGREQKRISDLQGQFQSVSQGLMYPEGTAPENVETYEEFMNRTLGQTPTDFKDQVSGLPAYGERPMESQQQIIAGQPQGPEEINIMDYYGAQASAPVLQPELQLATQIQKQQVQPGEIQIAPTMGTAPTVSASGLGTAIVGQPTAQQAATGQVTLAETAGRPDLAMTEAALTGGTIPTTTAAQGTVSQDAQVQAAQGELSEGALQKHLNTTTNTQI
jgi:hypothetical protein